MRGLDFLNVNLFLICRLDVRKWQIRWQGDKNNVENGKNPHKGWIKS